MGRAVILLRLLVVLALGAGTAPAAAGGGGLTLVICGAAGSFTVTLPGEPDASWHDGPCCILCGMAVAPPGQDGLGVRHDPSGKAFLVDDAVTAFRRPSSQHLPRGPPRA